MTSDPTSEEKESGHEHLCGAALFSRPQGLVLAAAQVRPGDPDAVSRRMGQPFLAGPPPPDIPKMLMCLREKSDWPVNRSPTVTGSSTIVCARKLKHGAIYVPQPASCPQAVGPPPHHVVHVGC